MKKYFLLFLVVFLIPQIVYMQTRVEEQISIDFSNDFPRPNETVSVTIESFQTDLNKANIKWFVNGELLDEGFGLKDFVFNSGNLGEETILSVRIEKSEGGVLEKSYRINPTELDLYYEAETFVPPFYEGRPSFSLGSSAKIVALPNMFYENGQKIPDDEISYTWKIDGTVEQRSSGVGRNVYYYTPSVIPRPVEVSVEAEPILSSQLTKESIVIEPVDPLITVYEKNPIYGTIFSQNIKDDFILNREEVELIAIPYDFSQDIIENGIFEWRLNGNKINSFTSNNIIFRSEGGASSNTVSIKIEHKDKFLQLGNLSFNLNFNDSSRSFNF